MPAARQRIFLAALIERIDVRADRIDIHLRPARLGMLLDIPLMPLPGGVDDEASILSMPMDLRRSGRQTKMLIEGSDPFATAKPDARLITRERRTACWRKMDSSSWSLWLIGPFLKREGSQR